MTPFATLRAIAADPTPCRTAQQIIAARLGGLAEPIPQDIADAIARLEKQMRMK